MAKTVGFPMIRNFSGDSRDFIPELFAFMDRYEDVEFYLEEGYGERLGYTADDYLEYVAEVEDAFNVYDLMEFTYQASTFDLYIGSGKTSLFTARLLRISISSLQ